MWDIFSKGKTNWETSYFGGVKRVLIEYPFISISYDLYTSFPTGCKTEVDLTVYQRDKLVNILFNEAFKKESYKDSFKGFLEKEAFKTIKDEELFKERSVKYYGRERLAIPVSTDVLRDFVNYAKRTELKSLFEYYGEDIQDPKTEITVHIDVPKGTRAEQEDQVIRTVKKFADSFKDKDALENLRVSVENIERDPKNKVKFGRSEIVFAKKLQSLLDITQDPKPDTVKNLLQGAMDSEKLAEVLAGNNRVYVRKVENESVKPFKVIVLGDYSGSMNCHDGRFNFQKQTMKALYHLFNDLMGMEDIEFYGHSGEDSPELYRFHSPEYPYFTETFNENISMCENYDGPVIEHIHKMVRTKSDKAVLLIVLSDGQPSGVGYGGNLAISKMKQILEKVKRDNFVTVGIGMKDVQYTNLYQYFICLKDFNKVSPVAQIINRAVKENLVLDE